MKFFILATASFLSIAQQKCGQQAAPAIPACIQAKIDTIKQQPKWNPAATVTEYLYNNKRVFVFSSNCCDQYNEAFDENCNYVCAPSGGMTGKGDRKCSDFKEKAKLVKEVWKDER